MASTAKGVALVAAAVVTVLAATGVWNPFPQLWTWISTEGPVAPGARWQQSLGGAPQSVAIVGDAVVVEYRNSVEAYGLSAGVRLWSSSDVDWAAVAGQGADAALVTGRLLTKGYQVRDPRTGEIRRSDGEAGAVWTYRDAIVDLRCAKGDDCRLTAWDPKANVELWRVGAGGIGFLLDAANPDLPVPRRLGTDQVDDDIAGPAPMPALLGLPDDGRIRVINTATGQLVQTVRPGADQRVTVTGGRVLTVTGTARDGTCYYEVTASDPAAGQTVWRREGLNLRTAENGGRCEQVRDPAGGHEVLLGVDPYGREMLIAAHDGRTLWRGDEGTDVLAVDDRHAVVRDGDTLKGYSYAARKTVWRQSGLKEPGAALTPYAAVVVGRGRVTAVSPAGGTVLADVRTDAKIFTVGPEGMIAVSGRSMAYLPFN